MKAASAIAPTTPMAPASVGVASPRKIVPSTRKISPSDGMMPRRHLAPQRPAAQRARLRRQRRHVLRPEHADDQTQAQNSATWMRLGPIAPAYMSPTERPSWSASTTSTSDGGMSWVMVPDAAITPMVWRVE